MLRKLTEAQCRAAIAMGEFEAIVAAAAPRVAVILTQSWCPQWIWMRSYLDAAAAANPETEIFWIEYDREPFFDDFMEFKENVFGNREIPYVRYYRDGKLTRQSNFIDKGGFAQLLGG
jgi:hypothetical protein